MLRSVITLVMTGFDSVIHFFCCGVCVDARIQSRHDGFLVVGIGMRA